VLHFEKEVAFMKKVFDKNVFNTMNYTNLIEQSVKLLEEFFNLTINPHNTVSQDLGIPLDFGNFLDTNLGDFVMIFREVYRYCFWNPFYGNSELHGHKIRDYPVITVLMIRINMLCNLLARLKAIIEESSSSKQGKSGRVNQNKMQIDKKPEEDVDRDIHYHRDSPDISHFTTYHFKCYYMSKRLEELLSAHITSMEMTEYTISENPTFVNVFNCPVFYKLFIPDMIEYEYSPFDIKSFKLKKEIYETDTPIRKVIGMIKELGLDKKLFGNNFVFLGVSIFDLLDEDLDLVAEWVVSVTSELSSDSEIAKLVRTKFMKWTNYFFPVDEKLHKSLKGVPALKKLTKFVAWNDCKLIDNDVINNDGNGLKISPGFTYFNPKTHSVLWSWILRVNFLQEIIKKVSVYYGTLGKKVFGIVEGWSEGIDDNNIDNESMTQLRERLHSRIIGNRNIKTLDTKLRKIRYNAYIELNNHTDIGVEMVANQKFDDKSLLSNEVIEGVNVDDQRLGFYIKCFPHPDSTLTSDSLPDITKLIISKNLDIKKKEKEKNPIEYCMYKCFPSTCEIRKIYSMIPNHYRSDRHARSYLFGLCWCSIMGFYEHANHGYLSKNFPKLIKKKAMYFHEIEIDGISLDKRRDELFRSISSNKYSIRDVLRENEVNYICKFLPALESYYKDKWSKEHYVDWTHYKVSCKLNMNFMREFLFKKNKFPIIREARNAIDNFT
jgi:hypothetical protein